VTEERPHLKAVEPSEPVVVAPASAVIVTRRGLLVYSLAIGLAIAGVVLLGVVVVVQSRKVGVQNRASIVRLDKLTHELEVLTHPTPDQFRAQLVRGIKLCLREPECRKLFPRGRLLAAQGRARNDTGSPAATPTPPRGSRPSTPSARRQPSQSRPPSVARRPPPAGSGGPPTPPQVAQRPPDPTPAPAPSAPAPIPTVPSLPSSPSPPPKPPVTVTTPGGGPAICTPILGINCP
jgi:hypothetical protein